jgi:pilus assembly protein CpaF
MAVRPKVPDHGALGALAPFAADPAVTDLLVDGLGRLWLDRGAGLVVSPHWRPVDPVAARRLAVGIVASGGRHLDDATPCVDVRLPGGIRAHAVLPPVSTAGPLLSVRIARAEPWRLADLEGAGMLTPEQGERLRSAVGERRNLLICGPAGSGKTSLLAALLAEVPPTERIVTVEDVAELVIDHPHVVGLEARQPNADGAGGVGLARLVREALRMRPDRLVVGECRGAEIVELLAAMNTGHDGGAGTLHSTGIAGVGARLEALGALAGLGPDALGRQVVAAVDLVVHLARDGGRRRVDRIGRFAGPGLEIVPAG